MSDAGGERLVLSASVGFPEDYRLLELTPEILAQLEDAGAGALVVRGRETDTAVLVDRDDRAYQLHTAHTSNSMYLMARDAEGRMELRTKLHQTLELQPTHPQIRARVVEILGRDPRGAFRGAEFEEEEEEEDHGCDGDVAMRPDGSGSVACRATDQVLARHVQSGDRQLRRVLAEIPAFRHAATGRWRAIDPGYCLELLRLILATQVERDWSLDALDAQQVCAALRSDAGGGGVLPEAVDAVLARFSRSVGPGVYAIVGTRVARYIAGQVFAAEGSRAWPVADFLAALRATMPPQLQIDELADPDRWGSAHVPQSLVRGMAYASALVDSRLLHTAAGVPAAATLLHPLATSTLPNEPRARLQRLFEAKARWSASEIRPFLEDLAGFDAEQLEDSDAQARAAAAAAAAKTADSWLLKFGRAVRSPDGEMVYASRLS
ncbi:Ctf8p and Ctf18p associating protein [Coemansia biformis]|uniref:Ctf8p and Ctf18p associating protein n=1 Tax=Coemansia biformis TaxID=1286918 RepID=A0A9W7YDK5_9FUNG|nr:Ctf8p and Ctf18p associating protein [Coemansia biformis]